MWDKIFKCLNSLVLILLLAAVACERAKEKTCQPPAFEKNLIGKWEASMESGDGGTNEVEFSDEGNYKESKGLFFGTHDVNAKISWDARNDSLFLSGKYSNNSSALYIFSLTQNTCDDIVLDLEGLDKLKLKRKK